MTQEEIKLTQEEIEFIKSKRAESAKSKDDKNKAEAIADATKKLNDRISMHDKGLNVVKRFYEQRKKNSKLKMVTNVVTFTEQVRYHSFTHERYLDSKARIDKLNLPWSELSHKDRAHHDIAKWGFPVHLEPISKEVTEIHLEYDSTVTNRKGEQVTPFTVQVRHIDSYVNPKYAREEDFKMFVSVANECYLPEGFFKYSGNKYNQQLKYTNIVSLESKMEKALTIMLETIEERLEYVKRKNYAKDWLTQNFPDADVVLSYNPGEYIVKVEGVGDFYFTIQSCGTPPSINLRRTSMYLESRLYADPIKFINALKQIKD